MFLVVLLAATAVRAETIEGRVRAVHGDAPVGLAGRTLALTSGAPEGGAGLRPGDCRDPRTAVLELAGHRVLIVVGRATPESETPDVVLVDEDGDGDFSAEERHPCEAWKRSPRGVTFVGGSVAGIELRLGGKIYPVDVGWSIPESGPGQVGVRGRWILEAEVTRGEKRFLVVLRDGDMDGAFEGEKDSWFVFAGKPPLRPVAPLSMYGLGLAGWVDGFRFLVRRGEWREKASIDMTIEPADGPSPEDLRRARERVAGIWAKSLEPSRAAFEKAFVLDTDRPKTTTSVAWRTFSFAEALLRIEQKKDTRPILVDLRAFSSEWAYRYDLHTYGDQEVADLLRQRFTPVRVIEEQADREEFRKLRRQIAPRGIPALGIYDTDGQLMHRIAGWRKPRDLVVELRGALERIEAKRKEDEEK
jgi:hypothetical protein